MMRELTALLGRRVDLAVKPALKPLIRTGVLACFDADKGGQKWLVDTHKEFNPPPLKFGTACSPLIDGEHVLVNVGVGRSNQRVVIAAGAVWKSVTNLGGATSLCWPDGWGFQASVG